MTPSPLVVGVDELDRVVDALRAGSVVAIPTDTVYGLAAALEPGPIAAVFEAKGRPGDLALPVLVGGRPQLAQVVASFPAAAGRLADRFWPGPLTIVVAAKKKVGRLLGGDGRTVGVRWPDHPFVEELCLATGPLAVTSANAHGEPPCSTASAVGERFDAASVALVVDGHGGAGTPSTVVDCTRAPRCLREGALEWALVESALG